MPANFQNLIYHDRGPKQEDRIRELTCIMKARGAVGVGCAAIAVLSRPEAASVAAAKALAAGAGLPQPLRCRSCLLHLRAALGQRVFLQQPCRSGPHLQTMQDPT